MVMNFGVFRRGSLSHTVSQASSAAGAHRREFRRSGRFADNGTHEGSAILYQETFETKLEIDQGFDLELSVGPALELRGTSHRFLLLPHYVEPSAPSGGTSFLVYGFDRSGTLQAARPDPGIG
jgi:hypothetical protein